jgi:lincosamide nucleotidyltransferase A/C/D/E
MTAENALALYDLFRSHGITVWVDGGWGVDALLGRQTRPHSDLDVALRHSDVPKLRALLEERGYRDVPRGDTRDCNLVLGNDLGHQIDVHSFELDAQGNNVFGCGYRAEHLSGEGTISGRVVKSIPPKQIIEFHTGYKIDDGCLAATADAMFDRLPAMLLAAGVDAVVVDSHHFYVELVRLRKFVKQHIRRCRVMSLTLIYYS